MIGLPVAEDSPKRDWKLWTPGGVYVFVSSNMYLFYVFK